MEDVLLAELAVLWLRCISQVWYFKQTYRTYRAVQWSLGSLSQVGYQASLLATTILLTSIIGLLFCEEASRPNIGEEQVYSQGSIVRLRTLTILLGSLGVGVSVAFCGPIAFVGLRVLIYFDYSSIERRWLCFISFIRRVFPNYMRCYCTNSTLFWRNFVGVITAALGAPMLIGLILFWFSPTCFHCFLIYFFRRGFWWYDYCWG